MKMPVQWALYHHKEEKNRLITNEESQNVLALFDRGEIKYGSQKILGNCYIFDFRSKKLLTLCSRDTLFIVTSSSRTYSSFYHWYR